MSQVDSRSIIDPVKKSWRYNGGNCLSLSLETDDCNIDGTISALNKVLISPVDI